MVRERDVGREPCPDRIIEDLGGAFGMGCVGGFIWHFVKGLRNSPKGEILSGGMYSGRMRAPILGGNFAVWAGTFSTFDCSFQYLRDKEDHWNAIASGFCTGGALALRGGWRSASRNAFIGGLLLGIIELVSTVVTRKTTPTPRLQYQQQMQYEDMMNQRNKSLNKDVVSDEQKKSFSLQNLLKSESTSNSDQMKIDSDILLTDDNIKTNESSENNSTYFFK